MLYLRSSLLLVLGLIAAVQVGCGNSTSVSAKDGVPTKEIPQAPITSNEVGPGKEEGKTLEIVQIPSKSEAAACIPKRDKDEPYLQSDCDNGLICVPLSGELSKGTCRISCGETEGKREKKRADKCAENRSCQVATSLSFDTLGTYCLPVQGNRDAPCSAVTDKQACSGNRICAVSEVSKDDTGQMVASSFLCRDSCPFGLKDADSACSAGEKCIAYPYETTTQSNNKGEPVMCTETKCQGDKKDCECDAANGFQCTAMIPGMIAFCERSAGICINSVPFSSVDDFASGKFRGEKCNEVKGHAYCDNTLFQAVDNGGESLCIQLSEATGDGFCFAFCSSPALDLNGDGTLLGQEVGRKFNCPADHSCMTQLGRTLGMVSAIPDKTASSGKKECDPSKCEQGQPCPGECGIGEAECLSYPRQNGQAMSFCGAPFGNCELTMSLR